MNIKSRLISLTITLICLLFAVNAEAKRELVPVFTSHSITKVYQVIVAGQFARNVAFYLHLCK